MKLNPIFYVQFFLLIKTIYLIQLNETLSESDNFLNETNLNFSNLINQLNQNMTSNQNETRFDSDEQIFTLNKTEISLITNSSIMLDDILTNQHVIDTPTNNNRSLSQNSTNMIEQNFKVLNKTNLNESFEYEDKKIFNISSYENNLVLEKNLNESLINILENKTYVEDLIKNNTLNNESKTENENFNKIGSNETNNLNGWKKDLNEKNKIDLDMIELKNIGQINETKYDLSVTKSLPIRFHIKGVKWNEKFGDINSKESQDFLKKIIIPLLSKRYNLSSEFSQVKLIRMFKNFNSSNWNMIKNYNGLKLAKKSAEQITNDLNNSLIGVKLFYSNEIKNIEVKKTHDGSSVNCSTGNSSKTDNYNFFYSINLINIENRTNLEERITGLGILIKEAVLKHFDFGKLKLEINIKQNNNKTLNLTESIMNITIPLLIELKSSIKLKTEDIKDSLKESALNKNFCYINKQEMSIDCSSEQKDQESLLCISDYWIELSDTLETKAEKLTLEDLFNFDSAWIIGLGIIGLILSIFFVGCVVAIFYTRRPYRRSGKIYELESGKHKNQISQMYMANNAAANMARIKNPVRLQY